MQVAATDGRHLRPDQHLAVVDLGDRSGLALEAAHLDHPPGTHRLHRRNLPGERPAVSTGPVLRAWMRRWHAQRHRERWHSTGVSVAGVPELPEVETIRRQLGPLVDGRRVTDAWSHPSVKFRPAVEVVGARLGAVGRRGKYLLIGTDDGRELVVHLGMTGSLRPAGPPADPYVRARWDFDDGSSLEFRDIRRFGRLRVVPAGDYSAAGTLGTLGPEPFDPAFTGDALWHALKSSRRRVKTQLLSQRPVAGIGNIYADEALWSSPRASRAAPGDTPPVARLADALEEVITAAIDRNGTTLRDYRTVEGGSGENQHHLRCYGRAGQPCLALRDAADEPGLRRPHVDVLSSVSGAKGLIPRAPPHLRARRSPPARSACRSGGRGGRPGGTRTAARPPAPARPATAAAVLSIDGDDAVEAQAQPELRDGLVPERAHLRRRPASRPAGPGGCPARNSSSAR